MTKMDFGEFRVRIENLIDDLFHGALGLGNDEHFRDLIGDGTGDDTKASWDEELKKIFNEVRSEKTRLLAPSKNSV